MANLEALIQEISSSIDIIYLEDIKADITIFDKIDAYLFMLRPLKKINPNNCAAILFTSGSEGRPKGVALSHVNILSNAAQISARIHFDHNDIVMNILPIFHCFGLNMGLILPLISGVKVFLYPSPLHYKTIPEIIYKSKATIFFGTDTFLSSYAKVSKLEQYRSIRYVLAGAEKLRSKTKEIWKKNFNIDILEGYGVTEASPVISLNTPAFNKVESAGIILPHMQFFLKNINGVKDGGQLYIKGPNVMMGYLHTDEPEVINSLKDGWHDTGDIAEVDENLFISIKGRVKRFAKIGGEMISLATIDGIACDMWPEATSVAAAKFDPKKGQKIILITNCINAKLEDLRSLMKSSGLPEIYVPAQLVIVEQIPLLGSGKADYFKIQELINAD
jgi:acyl-[acyl-carrier-protein]-phospholipid O-acyltransferase/long-chain-fatty-acid--[acyl-carrier-protein] ligase